MDSGSARGEPRFVRVYGTLGYPSKRVDQLWICVKRLDPVEGEPI
jgi:hypothetical protein